MDEKGNWERCQMSCHCISVLADSWVKVKGSIDAFIILLLEACLVRHLLGSLSGGGLYLAGVQP